MSDSFWLLMASRFVQGFGGSIGSVLGQAICRDAFQGKALSNAYSIVGVSLAIFPAIGPIIGGMITQAFDWRMIFIFLIGFGCFVLLATISKLSETLTKQEHEQTVPSLLAVLFKLAKDQKVIGYGLLVAGCNGILFSYFAEGSFYLIDLLGLSPSAYGSTFMLLAIAVAIGGLISKKLHNRLNSLQIINYGIWIVISSCTIFSIIILLSKIVSISPTALVVLIVACMMVIMAGKCMITVNSLAMALQNYRQAIGTASALFGSFYYLVISLFTLGMGLLHDGTLVPMPLCFLSLGLVMKVVFKILLKE